MSKERILDTIGQVKDKYIVEAAPKSVLEKTNKKSNRINKLYPYIKWGALAACLCLIVGLGMRMNLFSASKEDAAFEAKDAMMNQSAKTESIMEQSKSDAGVTMDSAETDYNTSIPSDAEYGTPAETPMTDQGFPDWGLTLSVKNVTSTVLTLLVTQSGGNPTGEIMTGEAYRLITLVDGTWKTVEELPLPEGVDGRAFNSLAYAITKGETTSFSINWDWIFGELPSGTYRLIKEFMVFKETGDYDTFEYWVEFEIQ